MQRRVQLIYAKEGQIHEMGAYIWLLQNKMLESSDFDVASHITHILNEITKYARNKRS